MAITAAADGSALGNPGPAGWAWYIDEERWHAGGWPHSTNNRGELMAVIDLLESTAHRDEPLRILCDSQYVINAVTKWMPAWKRKGWRKADGSPVLNRDLLQRLDAAMSGRSARFEWVKGHAGHDLNEAADDRARAAAVSFQRGTQLPAGPGFPGASDPPDAAGAVPAPGPAAPTLFDDLVAAGATAGTAHDDPVAAELVNLERELQLAMAGDRTAAAALLHPEFSEIGSSGSLYSRSDVLGLVGQPGRHRAEAIEPLSVSALGPDTALLVYRAGATLRSSLWQRHGGRWAVRFHQGTPTRR